VRIILKAKLKWA